MHNKAISILPSKDGRVYEMRKNDIGTFITPVSEIDGLDCIKTGFRMNLPKIPWTRPLLLTHASNRSR